MELSDTTIFSKFQRVVERVPDATAVRSRRVKISYRDLYDFASGVAVEISRHLPKRPARVALLLQHDGLMIAAIMGVLKTCHAYVPLNLRHSADVLKGIIDHSGSELVLTQRSLLDLGLKIASPRALVVIDDILPNSENSESQRSSGSISYILYTTGTTGPAKGVMQSDRNVIRHIANYGTGLKLNSSDTLILLAPYSFDASVMDIFGALLNGCCLTIFDIYRDGFNEILDWTNKVGVTIWHSTPTVARLAFDADRVSVLKHVRYFVLGGEKLYPADIDLFRNRISTDCIIVNGYGPTEMTVATQARFAFNEEQVSNPVSIGTPVAGVTIKLVDPQISIEEIPAADGRTEGEIVIEADHVALGYWCDEALTSARFLLTDQTGRRIYRTGDLGKAGQDGNIAYVGRVDRKAKIRGNFVDLSEVEHAVISILPGSKCIAECIESLEGHDEVAAFIWIPTDGAFDLKHLRSSLARMIPLYAVPTRMFKVDSFGWNANGKVDREGLRSYLTDFHQAHGPRAERQNSGLWFQGMLDDIFGMPVDLSSNFFDAGGTSLDAVRIIDRIKAETGLSVAVHELLEIDTLSDLQKHIANNLTKRSLPEE